MSSINIRKKINFPESDIEIIYHGNRNSNTDLNKINFLLTIPKLEKGYCITIISFSLFNLSIK